MQILLLILSIFQLKTTSPQCTCLPITVEQNVRKSTLIFTGKVIKVDTIAIYEDGLPDLAYRGGHLAVVKIKNVLKGAYNKDTINIMTGVGHGDCGFNFKPEVNYIIYSKEINYEQIDSANYQTQKFYKRTRSYYSTTICDRTSIDIKNEEREVLKLLKSNQN
jgi:hypothetical protein